MNTTTRRLTAPLVTLLALSLTACSEAGPPLKELETGRTNLARAAALERLEALHGRDGLASLPELGPVLERIATEDPFSELRLRALELWQELPHPLVDDRLLLKVVASEPIRGVAITAARAYRRVWGERGTRLLFERFQACGTRPEIATVCHTLAVGLADDPRLSMTLLMNTRDAARSPRGEAEFALVLAGGLLHEAPSLRDDERVIAWLQAFASSGETAGLQTTAKRLLSRPRTSPR